MEESWGSAGTESVVGSLARAGLESSDHRSSFVIGLYNTKCKPNMEKKKTKKLLITIYTFYFQISLVINVTKKTFCMVLLESKIYQYLLKNLKHMSIFFKKIQKNANKI